MTTTNIPASEPQLGFIQRLLAERASQAPEGVDAFMEVIRNKRITKAGASSLINSLLTIPVDVVAAPVTEAGTPARDPNRRSNAYPGKCGKCGKTVAANAGYLTGSRATGWGCEHLEGACPAADDKPEVHTLTEIIGDLEDGRYAIPATSGETDVWYFLLGTNKGVYNPDKKGQRYVRMVAGGGNEFPVTNEWVRKAVAAVRAMGTIASMKLFAEEMHICARCGEDLTQVTSKVTGFGPTCRKKIGYVVSPEEAAEIKRLIAEAKAAGLAVEV